MYILGIDDISKTIGEIGNFILYLINIIKDTIVGVYEFLKELIPILPDMLSFLPSPLNYIITPIISIVIGIFIYKFVR